MGRQITALKLQQHNNQRVNVFLDGEFAFGLSRITAAWLRVGQELTDERITKLRESDGYEVALQRAIHFVEYRPRTESEVRSNLQKHEVQEEVIAAVLERLRAGGLVDDARFAQSWVENRSAFRPRSRKALAIEMRRKGLDGEAIEQALADVDQDEEENLAYLAAQKQARKLEKLERMEFRQKLGNFLARRGFNYAIIQVVVEKLWHEIEELHRQTVD